MGLWSHGDGTIDAFHALSCQHNLQSPFQCGPRAWTFARGADALSARASWCGDSPSQIDRRRALQLICSLDRHTKFRFVNRAGGKTMSGRIRFLIIAVPVLLAFA